MDLGEHAVGLLVAHGLTQDARRQAWGPAYSDHDLVFAREDGTPLRPERVTKRFSLLVKHVGLRPVRLHDLRHGRASLLLASGTDIAVVSKMLGHSSIALTADTYSHLLDGVGRKAADAADALIPRRPRDQSVTSPVPGDIDGAVSTGLKGLLTSEDGGAPSGTRTPNPLIKSQLLCQLS